jgi:hypothetical protein
MLINALSRDASELSLHCENKKMNKVFRLFKHLLRQHAGTRDDVHRISDALAATPTPPRFILPPHGTSYSVLF